MSQRSLHRLHAAQADARAARAAFRATVEEAQERLSPDNLIAEVMGGVRARSLSVTGQAMESLRSRPLLSTVAVSLFGLLLNHRTEVFALIRLLLGRRRRATAAKNHPTGRKRARAVEVEMESDR